MIYFSSILLKTKDFSFFETNSLLVQLLKYENELIIIISFFSQLNCVYFEEGILSISKIKEILRNQAFLFSSHYKTTNLFILIKMKKSQKTKHMKLGLTSQQ